MPPKSPTIDIKTSGPGAAEVRKKMEKAALKALDQYGKPKRVKSNPDGTRRILGTRGHD
jgi:hypothetical protein